MLVLLGGIRMFGLWCYIVYEINMFNRLFVFNIDVFGCLVVSYLGIRVGLCMLE